MVIPLLVKDNIAMMNKCKRRRESLAIYGNSAWRCCDIQQLRAAGAIILAIETWANGANFRDDEAETYPLSSRLERGARGRHQECGTTLSYNIVGLKSAPVRRAAICGAARSAVRPTGSITGPSAVENHRRSEARHSVLYRKDGIIPIAHEQTRLDPMARSVTDVAICSEYCSRRLVNAWTSAASDYTPFLDPTHSMAQ